MNLKQIGNGIFEALRLATVEAGYFPDITQYLNPKDPQGWIEAKQVILSQGKELIEVFNVGNYNARPRKKTNDITLDRVQAEIAKRGTMSVPIYSGVQYTPRIEEHLAQGSISLGETFNAGDLIQVTVDKGEGEQIIASYEIAPGDIFLEVGAGLVEDLIAGSDVHLFTGVLLDDGSISITAPTGTGAAGNGYILAVDTTGVIQAEASSFTGGADPVAPKAYYLKTFTAKNLYDIIFQLQYIAYSEEYAGIIESIINRAIGSHATLFGYTNEGQRMDEFFVILRTGSFDTSGTDFIERGWRFMVPAKDVNGGVPAGSVAQNVEIKVDLSDSETNNFVTLEVP